MEAGPIFENGEPPQRILIEAREAASPCVVCGRVIAPGQLYLPGPPVRHLGCQAPPVNAILGEE